LYLGALTRRVHDKPTNISLSFRDLAIPYVKTLDNVKLPLKSSKKKGGECSFIAGMRPDTFLVSIGTWIHLHRRVEFIANWIEQFTFSFSNQSFGEINQIEIKQGKSRWTGWGAFRALRMGKLAGLYACNKLEKVSQ